MQLTIINSHSFQWQRGKFLKLVLHGSKHRLACYNIKGKGKAQRLVSDCHSCLFKPSLKICSEATSLHTCEILLQSDNIRPDL